MVDDRHDRWDAVLARARAADGTFFYGVRTTRIYCRPSCPARKPRREHVDFFESSVDAKAAGYRPCRRCDPDGEGPNARREDVVVAACRLIEATVAVPDLTALARTAGMSPHHFHRLFRSTLGITPKSYATALRAERVHRSLRESGSVTAAIYDSGFASSGRFYARSGDHLGMTPTQFRSGGDDAHVCYAVAGSSLGFTIVATTHVGVCFVESGPDRASLIESLRRHLPKARVESADAALEESMQTAVRTTDRATGKAIPRDIRGVAFHERVRRAMRTASPTP